MLYSDLFGKTNKSSKEYDSVNATYLIKGGFIDQTMAGVYTYLPLGHRVITKIIKIVQEEMDKVSQEMSMPTLSPLELWEMTGRKDVVDIFFKVVPANEPSKKNNDAEYMLNSTHEEVITPIAKKFNISYKELPFSVYQIQTKFRNEVRPKSGLLRAREFLMKDAYSFHRSPEEFQQYYKEMGDAYMNVFARMGLKESTYYTAASGGDFTDEFSHEFQIRCDTGEDLIFYDKEDKVAFNKEVAPSLAPEAEQDPEEKTMQKVETKNVTGVEQLAEFLKVPIEKTVKTILYETEKGVIAAAVRGDYDVNEIKLKKTARVKKIKLAEEKTIKKTTGAKVGFAGIVDLPKEIELYADETLKYMINFETGANKTDYHYINVNWHKDLEKPETFFDIKIAKPGDIYPETGEIYETFKASEAGNIFPLVTRYTEPLGYYFTNEKGEKCPVYMGSYGIGISRLMGIIVEMSHDDKGIIWPDNIAPYTVHLIGLNFEDESVAEQAFNVYEKLKGEGIEILYDNRKDTNTGEKLADADLIGIPYRVIVSKKTGTKIEVKKRNSTETELLSVEELLSRIK